jgi:HSP90 family molecular chaperone
MEYTFKKDFGFFKANDVLTWNEDIDAFTMDVEEGNSFRSAMIDERTVEDLRLEGLLAANAEPENDKINTTVEFIDSLLKQYEDDYKEVTQKYKEGKVQPCVKVEAETVYFNLTKVLNKIKEELTNE